MRDLPLHDVRVLHLGQSLSGPCSITGFGPNGRYRDLPAYDGVAMGYSGLAGLLLDPEDPQVRGPAMVDAITGHSAAFAIMAALHERHRTDRGAHGEHTDTLLESARAAGQQQASR